MKKFYIIKIRNRELFEKEFLLPEIGMNESEIHRYFKQKYKWFVRINHIEHIMYVTKEFDLEPDEYVVPLEY